MIGRRVSSAWHGLATGTIEQWQPLGYAMTDVLVRDMATGRVCWYASHGLTPIDDLGPLPSRREAQEQARLDSIASLEAIRAQHVADWHKPWSGAEHGKAILGSAIDGALASLRGR